MSETHRRERDWEPDGGAYRTATAAEMIENQRLTAAIGSEL